MPKPRVSFASEETIAQTVGPFERLLDVYRQEILGEDVKGNAASLLPTPADSSREEMLALVRGLAGRATYRVYINTMQESHRITHWVVVLSSNLETKFRHTEPARITPFYSETFEHAEYEAASWAAFLGVPVDEWKKPAWFDELNAKFEARRLETGEGSGSNPEVGGRLSEHAEEERVRIAEHERLTSVNVTEALVQHVTRHLKQGLLDQGHEPRVLTAEHIREALESFNSK